MPRASKPDQALATIRAVFDRVGFEYTEKHDRETATTYFDVDTGVSELEALHFVHQPGLLVGYALFGVQPPGKYRVEVERFATRFNAALRHGCVVVRAGEPVRVAYRASVDYSRAKDLGEGYVVGLVNAIVEHVPAIDLPLIELAHGKSAEATIARLFEECEEFETEPAPREKPAAAVAPAKKRAAKKTARAVKQPDGVVKKPARPKRAR